MAVSLSRRKTACAVKQLPFSQQGMRIQNIKRLGRPRILNRPFHIRGQECPTDRQSAYLEVLSPIRNGINRNVRGYALCNIPGPRIVRTHTNHGRDKPIRQPSRHLIRSAIRRRKKEKHANDNRTDTGIRRIRLAQRFHGHGDGDDDKRKHRSKHNQQT